MRLAFLLLLLGISGSAPAGWLGPSNYEECILENIKGVTIQSAVWAIKNACRAKFPEACYAWKTAHPNKPVQAKKPSVTVYEVGGVYNGYRYKGGGARDKSNWEPAQGNSYDSLIPDQTNNHAPEGCEAVLR